MVYGRSRGSNSTFQFTVRSSQCILSLLELLRLLKGSPYILRFTGYGFTPTRRESRVNLYTLAARAESGMQPRSRAALRLLTPRRFSCAPTVHPAVHSLSGGSIAQRVRPVGCAQCGCTGCTLFQSVRSSPLGVPTPWCACVPFRAVRVRCSPGPKR